MMASTVTCTSLIMTHAHVMHCWSWHWGNCVGSKASWPYLGGSNGGDDETAPQPVHEFDHILSDYCAYVAKTPIKGRNSL